MQGDYANTSIKADINLDNFLSEVPDGPQLPDLPGLPDLPVVSQLPPVIRACLTSGSLLSRPCERVLASTALLPQLRRACRRPALRQNPVCRALGATGTGGGGGGNGGGGGGPLDPLLPDLFRRGSSAGNLAELFGGAS